MSVAANSHPPLLLLIDGHSLAFQAYYAFAKARSGPLKTSTGIPTNVCFGFLNSLFAILESEKADALAVAFDMTQPTFRHESYSEYKGKRQATPSDFLVDLQNLQQLLADFNIPVITYAGYEADDVLATLAKQAREKGYRVKIVTGDRDLFQLVNEDDYISVLYLDTRKSKNSSIKYQEFNAEAVEEKLGIAPNQVIDFKALAGDSSDNIAGVRGIGKKTAVKLLKKYRNIAGIYENLANLSPRERKRLEEGKNDLELAKKLVTIVDNVPLQIDIDSLKLAGFNPDKVLPDLRKLELNSFIKNLDKLQVLLGGKIKDKSASSNEIREGETHQIQSISGQFSLFTNNNSIEQAKNGYKNNNSNLLDNPIKPTIIDTEEKLEKLITTLEQSANIFVAWDTETTSLEPLTTELIGIGCCWGEKTTEIAYIPLAHKQGKQLQAKIILKRLQTILADKKYKKAFHNTKFDRLVFLGCEIKLQGTVFDTMLASYVLQPEASHKLKSVSARYLTNIQAQGYEELQLNKGQTVADLAIETMAMYCGLDVYATFHLVTKLQAELSKCSELEKVFWEIEIPLEAVLAAMESYGIRLNTKYLQELSQQLTEQLVELEQKVYEYAGEQFNLASPKQLSEILFNKLALDSKKSKRTKTGYSTNQAVLEKLKNEHPIIECILHYRTLAKLKSTYVDALPKLINPKTQRIHTSFNQALTTTGRLSSSNPNLQNIPIRTEFSRQIRKAFIPAEGWFLLSADYSQIELRILAHLSQEPVLLKAYQQGEDVHKVTAQLLFEQEEITPEQRRIGKIINFGVIYGMGSQRFARESGLSTRQGKEFIEKYRQKYSQVFAYLDQVKKQAISQGYVKTIYGRRRYFEFTSESLKQLRGTEPEKIDLESLDYNYTDAQLLRAAANATIQGSSADIIKIAMIRLHDIFENYQARLLLQVHDELVIELPPEEREELTSIVKTQMEQAANLTVPLQVEVNIGKNWMEAK